MTSVETDNVSLEELRKSRDDHKEGVFPKGTDKKYFIWEGQTGIEGSWNETTKSKEMSYIVMGFVYRDTRKKKKDKRRGHLIFESILDPTKSEQTTRYISRNPWRPYIIFELFTQLTHLPTYFTYLHFTKRVLLMDYLILNTIVNIHLPRESPFTHRDSNRKRDLLDRVRWGSTRSVLHVPSSWSPVTSS